MSDIQENNRQDESTIKAVKSPAPKNGVIVDMD